MNINAQAYNQYKKSTVETVSSEKLLLMLYDGAIKSINNAKKAIEEKDINLAHREIMRVEEIIVELMSTLNMDYEISAKLFALYEYFYYQLTQANAKKDIGILNEVEAFLLELRDTWREAALALKNAQPQAEVAPSPQPVNNPAPAVTPPAAAPPLGGVNKAVNAAAMPQGINIRG